MFQFRPNSSTTTFSIFPLSRSTIALSTILILSTNSSVFSLKLNRAIKALKKVMIAKRTVMIMKKWSVSSGKALYLIEYKFKMINEMLITIIINCKNAKMNLDIWNFLLYFLYTDKAYSLACSLVIYLLI
ncbi:unknown; predicted coding region [Mycoplasmopsis pulmonis]|uniref:Uncharacterized protein n=1 Tax=Mycoplasmopsis pulmonis (strain UAB CTIP) TaxID=272635 RepID=Q98R20_MYCPU|nr:unknown; predicted coding region [Mycoplasmopsis pulmonis]